MGRIGLSPSPFHTFPLFIPLLFGSIGRMEREVIPFLTFVPFNPIRTWFTAPLR